MNNLYGNNIKLKIFGASQDDVIGMVLEGFPAGVKISVSDLHAFMARRAPGNNPWSTQRKEPDVPEFESGVVFADGVYQTDGGAIKAVIRNTNQHSADYSSFANIPRPSHADYPARVKFGDLVDLRGGGKYSGRLTAPLCIAGALCLAYLNNMGITVGAHILGIGGVTDDKFDCVSVDKVTLDSVRSLEFPLLNRSVKAQMKAVIEDARSSGDSVGGVLECAVIGLPVGLGDHPFDGLESRISSVVFSIPAVKAIEFGDGFDVALKRGSTNNDAYYADSGKVFTKTNHSGGIVGGMSNGMPLIFRGAIKPTPSIYLPQDSVDLSNMQNTSLVIKGRHDPCIVPRAVPIFEAAAAIAIVDALLD